MLVGAACRLRSCYYYRVEWCSRVDGPVQLVDVFRVESSFCCVFELGWLGTARVSIVVFLLFVQSGFILLFNIITPLLPGSFLKKLIHIYLHVFP